MDPRSTLDATELLEKPKLELPPSCKPPGTGLLSHQLVWIVRLVCPLFDCLDVRSFLS